MSNNFETASSTAINAPKLSVIIPVYNAGSTIGRTLTSLISQCGVELEIICIDDGSTDDSRDIIAEWIKKDTRISYFYQVNKGSGPARNAGIEVATGDYLAFMDPDDWLPDDNVYRTLIDAAERYKVSAAGGNLFRFDRISGEKLGLQDQPFTEDGILTFSDYQYSGYYQRFIFKKKLIDECNLSFPPYRRYQDPIFFVRALDSAGSFYVTTECTYCYACGPQNIKWTSTKILDWCQGVHDVLKFALDNSYYSLYEMTCSSFYDALVFRACLGLVEVDPTPFNEYSNLLQSIDSSLLKNACRYKRAVSTVKSFERFLKCGQRCARGWIRLFDIQRNLYLRLKWVVRKVIN